MKFKQIISYYFLWTMALIFLMTFGCLTFFQAFGVITAAQFIIWANDILKLELH
jgi:hypothetical protein